MIDIHDLIKHAKFGDDRLRRSGVVAGQISAFPIDFAGSPYNTLTLLCERVIHIIFKSYNDFAHFCKFSSLCVFQFVRSRLLLLYLNYFCDGRRGRAPLRPR